MRQPRLGTSEHVAVAHAVWEVLIKDADLDVMASEEFFARVRSARERALREGPFSEREDVGQDGERASDWLLIRIVDAGLECREVRACSALETGAGTADELAVALGTTRNDADQILHTLRRKAKADRERVTS